MNNQKIVVGGLAAGVTLFIIDLLSNLLVIGDRFTAELEALSPSLAANLESTGPIVGIGIAEIVMGILLVWLYAAIRPNFGPGPKTAMIAGFFFWLLTGAVWVTFPVIGIISWGMWMLGGVFWLIASLASAYVGGMVYKE